MTTGPITDASGRIVAPPQTAPPRVSVCAWCPTAQEDTASARARGFKVSHGICEQHAPVFERGARV